MRLISSFKDHYDAFLRDGDLSTTWERKTATVTESPLGPENVTLKTMRLVQWKTAITMAEEFPDLMYRPEYYRYDVKIPTAVISIAGKLHLVLCIREGWHPKNAACDYKPTWAGSYNEAIGKFKEPAEYLIKNRRLPVSESVKRYYSHEPIFADEKFTASERGLAAWQEKWGSATSTIESHVACNSPVYIVRGDTVVANPNLADFGLYRRIDAYTIAQEIEVYMNNELAVQRDPIPKRTDELIRDAHGFDKHSFRNTQPDRRARKSR